MEQSGSKKRPFNHDEADTAMVPAKKNSILRSQDPIGAAARATPYRTQGHQTRRCQSHVQGERINKAKSVLLMKEKAEEVQMER
jgi:hypothetical protein